MPGGIDFCTIGSRCSSIHARAAGRLDFVVTSRHLFRVTDSICRNHGCRVRWLERDRCIIRCIVGVNHSKPSAIFEVDQHCCNIV